MSQFVLHSTQVSPSNRLAYSTWHTELHQLWTSLKPRIKAAGYDPLMLRRQLTGSTVIDADNYWLCKYLLGEELGGDVQRYIILFLQIHALADPHAISANKIAKFQGEKYWFGEDAEFKSEDEEKFNLTFQ